MKRNKQNSWITRMLSIGLLAISACATWAQDLVITRFDDGNFVTNGIWSWWGGAVRSWQWDPTVDAGGGANPGSLKISVNFSGTGDNQYSLGMSFSGQGAYNGNVTLSTIDYTNLEFDLLWDTNSTLPLSVLNTAGDPQGLGLGLATPGWGQTWIPYPQNPHPVGAGNWEHVSIPLNPSWPNAPGMVFKHWFNNDTNNVGTMTFWIDNIVAIHNTNIIVPHPTMKIEPAPKGLHLMASVPGGQYQREGIRSIPADAHQWYGNPDPITYSVTFAKFPDGALYGGLQGHIFLVPDTAGGNSPDYGDPNAIMLDIKALASNGGTAVFRFKTNQPNGNGQMYTSGQGQLVTLNTPSVVGTWSLTFSNNNNVTLVGPGGVGTNFNMPADAAALFQSFTPSMGTYFGIQPNNVANVSQRAVISHIKITDGSTVVVDDTFPIADPTQETDPNNWINRVDGGVTALKVVDSSPSYWVNWNLPDPYVSAFEMSTSVLSGWADAGLPFRLNGGRRDVFVGPSVTAGAPASYFRLVSTNSP